MPGRDWRGLWGVDPIDLFLLPNVTTALNLAVASIRLDAGDVILTTDHEYGAMRLLLEHLARRDGATIRTVRLPYRSENPDDHLEAITTQLDDRVRLVFFSHVTSPTGVVLPARTIVERCRRIDRWIVIDGAHACGAIEVDIGSIGADAYGSNGHKWMMNPCGAGFLHVSQKLKPRLEPLVRSWGDACEPARADEPMVDEIWKLDFGCTRLQYRLEYPGVVDRVPQMAYTPTLDFIDRVTLARMRDESLRLGDVTHSRLSEIGLIPASPLARVLRSPMTIFDLTDGQADAVRSRLRAEHRIICPTTRADGRWFLRVSTGWFNHERQIEQLAGALTKVLF
jgi:isopenicillin-N epimerase